MTWWLGEPYCSISTLKESNGGFSFLSFKASFSCLTVGKSQVATFRYDVSAVEIIIGDNSVVVVLKFKFQDSGEGQKNDSLIKKKNLYCVL